MEVTFKNRSHDLCGGECYYYDVNFSHFPITIAEALKEIDDWRDTNGEPRGGFGHAYGTYVNGEIVESTWVEPNWRHRYLGSGNELVNCVEAYGGWCCGVNINLKTNGFLP